MRAHIIVINRALGLLYLNPGVMRISAHDLADIGAFGAWLESEYGLIMPPVASRDVRRAFLRLRDPLVGVFPFAS